MSTLSKEETAVIDKMFSWCASSNDMAIIRQSIAEVKKGNGLYVKAVTCKGDLYSFKSVVAEHTGLGLKASGELGRILYHLVKSSADRERMIRAGIVHGIWVYDDFACKYSSHAKFNGLKFRLLKGIKSGLFARRVFPQQLVGCGCMAKPEMPF